jgi:hypothetical protein
LQGRSVAPDKPVQPEEMVNVLRGVSLIMQSLKPLSIFNGVKQV